MKSWIIILTSACCILLCRTVSAGDLASTSFSSEMESTFPSDFTGIDVTHQALHLNVDPRVNYISGRVETTFKALESSLTTIILDLHDEMNIDSIHHESGTSLTFRRNEGHTFEVDLPAPMDMGETATIFIYYQGAPEAFGFGSFVQTAHSTDSIIWTLSEPYGARDWWPCYQNLHDKIDSIDLWITVPEGYRAASNGLLLSESDTENDQVTFHWSHRYPIATYLVALAVTNYQVYQMEVDLANGPLTVLNYLYPQDFDRHSAQIDSVLPPMMQLFEDLFIPYPFDQEKYGHAQFGFGGGMEHQTMSFMGGFSHSLIAHELAHQWFGDYVTCGSWQDIWLNEGFADYLTGLTYEHLVGGNSWSSYLTASIRNITSAPGGSVFVPDTTTTGRIFNSRLTYRKGGMVLHMLRWIVGDEDFYEGIRNYLQDEETRFSFVKTRHLMDHLEQVSGRDLDDFFQDWYTGQGFPSYEVRWQNTDTTLLLTISQTTSHESVDFFELPLELGLYGAETDSLIRLEINENGESFEIPMPWHVDSIAVDPRHWIVSKDNTTRVMTDNQGKPSVGLHRIFPNPTSGIIFIENRNNEAIRTVDLYTTMGRRVRTFHQNVAPGITGRFDPGQLPAGLYFVVIRGRNGGMHAQKVMIGN